MSLYRNQTSIAITGATLLLVMFPFTAKPSWACSASGGSGFSSGSQTDANSVTVCAKQVTTTKVVTKPAPKPVAAPAKPVVVAPKPVSAPPKAAPKPAPKPVATPPKVKLSIPLAPAKLTPPPALLKPTPTPVTKPIAKPAVPTPAKPTAAPKPVAAKTQLITSSATGQASFTPAPLVALANPSSVAVGTSVNFSVNPSLHFKAGEILGKSATVMFSPGTPRWTFDDGSSLTGKSVNRTFLQVGQRSASVSVDYAVSYQFSGDAGWTDSGSITVSDSVSVEVTAAADYSPPAAQSGVVRLVGGACGANSSLFGCGN